MKKLFSGIKWFEDTLTSAFLSIVVLITLANVVARYVMKSSIPWAQEISGFFWTWTVMIGMSVGYRRNLHLWCGLPCGKASQEIRHCS